MVERTAPAPSTMLCHSTSRKKRVSLVEKSSPTTQPRQDQVFVSGSILTPHDLQILKSPTNWLHAFSSSSRRYQSPSTPTPPLPHSNQPKTNNNECGLMAETRFFFDGNGDPVNVKVVEAAAAEATPALLDSTNSNVLQPAATYTNKHLKRRSCDIVDALLDALVIESNPESPMAPPSSPVGGLFGNNKKYCVGNMEHCSIASAVEAIMKDQCGSLIGSSTGPESVILLERSICLSGSTSGVKESMGSFKKGRFTVTPLIK
ncbi:hypothetical protein BDR26DRAFT_856449 [Obelidium mucronatum]|nr:hypothetical protein BDR26DRAFT_856449 [Obelidium mucronatum]